MNLIESQRSFTLVNGHLAGHPVKWLYDVVFGNLKAIVGNKNFEVVYSKMTELQGCSGN